MLTALDVLADPFSYEDHRSPSYDGFEFVSSPLNLTEPSPAPPLLAHRRSRSLGLPPASCSSAVRRGAAPGIETVLEEDEDRLSSRAPSAKSSPLLSSSPFLSPTPSPLTSPSFSSFDDFFLQLRNDFPSAVPSSASSASPSSSSSSSPQLGHSLSLGHSSAESLVDPATILLSSVPLKAKRSGCLGRFVSLAAPGPAPTWALPALPGKEGQVEAAAVVTEEDGNGSEWDGEGSVGYWDALDEFEGM